MTLCTEISCGDSTGVGDVFVAIVPVKVRIKGSNNIITTYAAQDPYSTAAFVTDSLLAKLGAKGKPSEILLTTMEKEQSVMKTQEVLNIEVLDIDENNIVHVPVAYSRKSQIGRAHV